MDIRSNEKSCYLYKDRFDKKNQIFILLVLVPVMCDELAKRINATYAKTHGAKSHQWQLASIRATRGLNPVTRVRWQKRLPTEHLGEIDYVVIIAFFQILRIP